MTIAASVSPTTDPSPVQANASAKSDNPNPIFDGNSGTSDVEQGHESTPAQVQGEPLIILICSQQLYKDVSRENNPYLLMISLYLILNCISY